VFILRRDLFVRVAREYLEAAVIDEALKPMDFVRNFLGTEANFDPLTATWLFLQSRFERVELENELAMAVAHLVEAWPQIVDGTQVTVGPVFEDIVIGAVVCSVNIVDIAFGDHCMGIEIKWQRAGLSEWRSRRVRKQQVRPLADPSSPRE
jgi:hypothetical protein